MLIFAHRGLKLEYPENTLAAFKAAADLGFGIELDVRLREDGELVCVHDRDVQAMLSAPKFEDVVKRVITEYGKERKAAIHVKGDEQGEEQMRILLEVFGRYQLHAKALLFDLTIETAEKTRGKDPNIEIALSVGEDNYSPTIYTWQQVREHLDLFDTVWWDEWKIPGSVYIREIARAIHETGKKIYAISPELHLSHGHPHAAQGYEEDWEKFIQLGIEGVCTAHPRELKALLES